MERKTIEKIEETKEHTLVIEGRNAVLEAFRSGRTIDKLFVLDGCQDGPVRTTVREAKKHGTILNFVGKERLSQLTQTGRHQGVIAYAAAYDHSEEESGWFDGDRSENFGRGVELYSGCKSDKSCKDNGRIERKRNLVCLRRYGRTINV